MSEVPSILYVYYGVDEVPMDVTHVRVDSSVTVIPTRAFSSRRLLEEVELPEGLITIERQAFEGCETLKTINIPSAVTEIGHLAFNGCSKLDEITLPDGLQQLGQYAFFSCHSLKSINIPPNIETIQGLTFFKCESLTTVEFDTEGVQEIGSSTFSSCKSLVSVNLPSSLKVIGESAFQQCQVLNNTQMQDAVETIGVAAFRSCNLINFRMPPLITDVDLSILDGNRSLISIELSENITALWLKRGIGKKRYLESLRNITIPSDCDIDMDLLDNWDDLKLAFTERFSDVPDIDTIREALQHRFDELPIHKICYYQSYHDTETTMQSLKREINPWTTKPPGQLNTTGKQQDCLGMTPLHILACSTKPTIEMYQLLIEKYPETLIMEDKWGDIPLMYAFWCKVPTEILDLLVTSYKTIHPDYEFDWSGMIHILSRCNVPLENIQKLVDTQTSSFPDQEYDMQGTIRQLAIHDEVRTIRSQKDKCTRIETFRYLVQVSTRERLDLIAVERWRIELEDRIEMLPKKANNRKEDVKAVYDRLATYESIKEATSILELALWKAKLDESRNKRARVDGEVSYRGQCRINSRADIVIRNVLPYLLPKPLP